MCGWTRIPTHRPMVRIDQNDLIYLNRNGKYNAIIQEIEKIHAEGVAPILIGTATIEVVSQDGSHKATATVEVTEPVVAVTGVSVDPSTTSVEANKTVQLTANIEPAGATNKRVTWASKNAEFATVDSATGLVTGVAAGTATIEVTTEDGSHKATATVEVTAAPAA